MKQHTYKKNYIQIKSNIRLIYFPTSLILFIVYVFGMLPPPSIALTGSPALRNFLFTASIGGDISVFITAK